jgi:hypothetical protein
MWILLTILAFVVLFGALWGIYAFVVHRSERPPDD